MQTSGYASTHVGLVRETNEDRALVDDELGLYLVCDGLGGHAAGETAAETACAVTARELRGARERIEAVGGGEAEHEELREIAEAAVRAAAEAVYELATTDAQLAGMGCTLTLLLVAGARGVMVHVGDTRLYLLRDGATWQLSSDHTVAAENMRKGLLTPDAMRTSPLASALTRAIGAGPSVHPETLILEVLPDDVFLLCSDGLGHYLEGPGELGSFLREGSPEACAEALVACANERGGHDNVTALVVQVLATDEEQRERYEMAADVRIALDRLREVRALRAARFADLLRLLELADLRVCSAGEQVFAAGDELHGLYLPLDGELELRDERGEPVPLDPAAPPGLASLLAPRRSSASLSARTRARLLCLRGEDFLALARRRPWFGVAVLTELAASLADG